jgi:hypothetical protein
MGIHVPIKFFFNSVNPEIIAFHVIMFLPLKFFFVHSSLEIYN